MLARTPAILVYLSAAGLGITERERAGLIEVRDDLASGRVRHARIDEYGHQGGKHDKFNMMRWDGSSSCGTVHCIGGFMQHAGHLTRCVTDELRDDGYSMALQPLFYPKMGISGDETVSQAVAACDHFLSGAGPDCWPMALADVPL